MISRRELKRHTKTVFQEKLNNREGGPGASGFRLFTPPCPRMMLVWALCACASLASAAPRHKRQTARGPLYEYVHEDDGAFAWTEYSSVQQRGFTTHFLNLTSQVWYDESLSNRPLWWHYLIVHIPTTHRFTDAGFLFVTMGDNTDGHPGIRDYYVWRMAEFTAATGIITGVVKLVPNQPIVMGNDGVPRIEDNFIAWTWRRFYNESHAGIDNPGVLSYMPMVKSAVRAMDAMQELVKERTGHDLDNFMVAGESKRGWTTWLMGAIDDRVIAIAPMVLSCLNIQENFHHYWKSLGGWSWTMHDYWSQGLMGLIDEPEMEELYRIIDPYSYLEYLTMPKLMMSGASDEFFMPDDYDYFYKDLIGEKRILMLENSGHGYGPRLEDYWSMLATFYLSVLGNHTLPTIDWTREYTATGGSIIFLSSVVPTTIKVWAAKSIAPNRRDWRMSKLGDNFQPEPSSVIWLESAAEDLGAGYYRAQFDNPDKGYLAFFISMSYPGPEGRTYYFTTETAIIPDNFPHTACEGMGCTGVLV